jgi:hypothetical protein
MPTRAIAVTQLRGSSVVSTWTGLLNTDDGAPYDWSDGPAESFVAVTGTFGTGGSLTIQGSNDGTNWVAMSLQPSGAATFTAAGGGDLAGTPRFVRPIVTAGDGATNLTVTMTRHAVRSR